MLYCANNRRPAADPEILFRMLFAGDMCGIKSEACQKTQDGRQQEEHHRKKMLWAEYDRKDDARHVRQDAATAFTKMEKGRSIYKRRKEAIERSFAETKVHHGLHFARMLGIRNMREQSS